MSQQLFLNNAFSSLGSGVTTTGTTLQLASGGGASFPSPTTGQYFLATLVGLDTSGNENSWEVVQCTARSGDYLTVVRAQESTLGVAWAAGTRIEMRATAATFSNFVGSNALASGLAAFFAVASSANFLAALADKTGTGVNVFATSPTLVTPNLGTPSAVVLTNATGMPWSGMTGLPTTLSGYGITNGVASSLLGATSGVATLNSMGQLTASQIPSSLVGAVVYQGVWNANTNSPSLVSGTGTKGNYYKVSTAGTTSIDGNAVWNIGDTIIFDGTTWDKIDGAQSELFSGGALGTPSSGTLTNCTGLPYSGLTGTVPTWNQNTTGAAATLSAALAVSLGGTGATATTGSGSNVLATSPTITTPTLSGTTTAGAINASGVVTGVYNSAAAGYNGFLAQNSAGSDGMTFGWTSSTYTTGGPLTWAGNNAPYIYAPSGSTINVGIGTANKTLAISSTGLAVTGALSASSTITAGGSTPSTSTTGYRFGYSSPGTAGSPVSDAGLTYSAGAGVYFVNTFSSNSGCSIGFNTTTTGGVTAQTMLLNSSGNLGLGVTPFGWGSGYTAFDIGAIGNICYDTGSSAINVSSNAYNNGSGWLLKAAGAATLVQVKNGTFAVDIAPAGSANGTAVFSQALTVDNSGNLLVGCTSSGYFNSQLTLSRDGGTNKWCVGPYSSTPTGFVISQNATYGVYLATTSSTAWATASDERIKTDLVPITDAVAKLSTLRTVTGRFIADDSGVRKPFLMAQDVLKVQPEAVDTSNPDRLGLQYQEVIPLMVAAINELAARLAALEAA